MADYYKDRLAQMRAGTWRPRRRRKEFCYLGHPLHTSPSGQTRCRTCEAERNRRRRAARGPVVLRSAYDGSIVDYSDLTTWEPE